MKTSKAYERYWLVLASGLAAWSVYRSLIFSPGESRVYYFFTLVTIGMFLLRRRQRIRHTRKKPAGDA